MANVLQIEDYLATTNTLNLLSPTAIAVFIGEGGGEMPLKTGGVVTRVFRFKVTGATKAAARANVNLFLKYLKKVTLWHGDILQNQSIFLREAADGETPMRWLIKDWQASAVEDSTAIDAFQTTNKDIYVNVAITLQNHRERVAKTTLTEYAPSADVAVGKRVVLEGDGNITTNSRVFLTLTSSLSGNYLTNFWIGMRPHLTTGVGGDTFLHLWYFDYATALAAGTTETTETGSYGTNIAKVTFSNNLMANRVKLNVGGQYTAQSVTLGNQTRGRYVVLLRYKDDTAGGSVLLRVGVSSAEFSPVSYNEARLIDSDDNWHMVNLGVVQFPPHGVRQEESVSGLDAACYLHIDAQRLSGTATVCLDTLTFIPYDHYLYVENAPINEDFNLQIITNEDMGTVARIIDDAAAFKQMSTIVENNNFIYPYDQNTNSVLLVYAGDNPASHAASTNLDNGAVTIFEAVEGYYD